MSERGNTLTQIDGCLARLRTGDEAAWDDLVTHAFDRLLALCARILGRDLSRPDPLITENAVLSEAYLRLRTAMRNESARPATAAEFFGLAARNIRWQIRDMLRKPAARREGGEIGDGNEPPDGATGLSLSADNDELWVKFWETVDAMAEDERRVFDLLWVNELSQYEAAEALGLDRNRVDTVWRRVKLKIGKACQNLVPLA